MASLCLALVLALSSFLPFSSSPILHLFSSLLSSLPTSVLPCGKFLRLFLVSLFLFIVALVSWVCVFAFPFSSQFLHSPSLSRRALWRLMFCTRAQCVSLEAKIFLGLVIHHPRGLLAVAAHICSLSGLSLSTTSGSLLLSATSGIPVLCALVDMIGWGLRALLSCWIVLSALLASKMLILQSFWSYYGDSLVEPLLVCLSHPVDSVITPLVFL